MSQLLMIDDAHSAVATNWSVLTTPFPIKPEMYHVILGFRIPILNIKSPKRTGSVNSNSQVSPYQNIG
jgi:hypothetical protein